MRQLQTELAISTRSQGYAEITGEARRFVEASGMETGQLTLLVQHTSASPLIQENADKPPRWSPPGRRSYGSSGLGGDGGSEVRTPDCRDQ
jgi:hypothetical protein